MGEELHEIVQNSSNEEYTENKQSGGSNVERDKEGDETEESALQGVIVPIITMNECGWQKEQEEATASRTIRLFHISLEHSGGKKHLLLWK